VNDPPPASHPFTDAEGCLEALPVAAMVVDRDHRILAVNGPARAALGVGEQALGQRPGEVIGCVTARRQGCNRAGECTDCTLWRAVEVAFRGQPPVQREFPLEVAGADGTSRKVFLASAGPARGPLADQGGQVVVVLQDITLLHRLSGLVPICASCKSVRRPDQGWEAVETFVEAHSHALFSHTFCPECLERYYREPGGGGRAERG
jgi:hypothetical protein